MAKHTPNVRNTSQGYRTTNYDFSAEFAGNKKELPDCMYKTNVEKQDDIKARKDFHSKYKNKNSMLAQQANKPRRFKRVIRTEKGIVVLGVTQAHKSVTETLIGMNRSKCIVVND